MIKVLISACLVGEPIRYNGKKIVTANEILNSWKKENRIIPVCPEVLGGLSVPRPRAEIINGQGEDVLSGQVRVIDISGRDLTASFVTGAQKVLELALKNKISFALLTDDSPSCGSSYIYNGRFDGTRIPGMGVTACMLKPNGLKIFNMHQLKTAND